MKKQILDWLYFILYTGTNLERKKPKTENLPKWWKEKKVTKKEILKELDL